MALDGLTVLESYFQSPKAIYFKELKVMGEVPLRGYELWPLSGDMMTVNPISVSMSKIAADELYACKDVDIPLKRAVERVTIKATREIPLPCFLGDASSISRKELARS